MIHKSDHSELSPDLVFTRAITHLTPLGAESLAPDVPAARLCCACSLLEAMRLYRSTLRAASKFTVPRMETRRSHGVTADAKSLPQSAQIWKMWRFFEFLFGHW